MADAFVLPLDPWTSRQFDPCPWTMIAYTLVGYRPQVAVDGRDTVTAQDHSLSPSLKM